MWQREGRSKLSIYLSILISATISVYLSVCVNYVSICVCVRVCVHESVCGSRAACRVRSAHGGSRRLSGVRNIGFFTDGLFFVVQCVFALYVSLYTAQ